MREVGRYRFGPESILWNVNKEKAVALAGERALLMQIAHPLGAQAIHDSRLIENHPLQRLIDTANLGFAMVFAPMEEGDKVARSINSIHAHVKGELKESVGAYDSGAPYSARDQELLAWVAATIIDSSIVGYETFVGKLKPDEKDRYLTEAKSLFGLLRLKEDSLPSTYAGLQLYIDEMIASEKVKVGLLAKDIMPYVLLSHRAAWKAVTMPLRLATIYTLPNTLREQFEFSQPEWQEKLVSQAAGGLRKVLPYLPPEISKVLSYRRAKKELRSK